MIGLSARLEGENPFTRLERVLPEVLRASLEQALQVGLAASLERMRPGGGGPQIRSGRLANSLRTEVFQDGDTWVGRLSADAPYAAAQEYGAVIQAKQRKYLKFQVQGRWVQKQRVELPARPYLRPGAEAAAEALREIIAQKLMEAMA
ncbi:MAG: hypothetical protein KMY53_08080 [Desulfarculus sp.]|nr:hypothetical protein [Pseudomonadota bacterium]MBV1716796.1 hypothetical protein [Desulfarculus sp.]MBU4573191.1 hypothetical protein [Pseudomonadota bacterium]MBU4598853.1 hypothetical protein [Pseudomonadota bacterium]MBV1738104.1 hypothetical protein [Desulfarculus sp.]